MSSMMLHVPWSTLPCASSSGVHCKCVQSALRLSAWDTPRNQRQEITFLEQIVLNSESSQWLLVLDFRVSRRWKQKRRVLHSLALLTTEEYRSKCTIVGVAVRA
eukprot:1725841-Rhodomonas_salina.3